MQPGGDLFSRLQLVNDRGGGGGVIWLLDSLSWPHARIKEEQNYLPGYKVHLDKLQIDMFAPSISKKTPYPFSKVFFINPPSSIALILSH